MFFCFDGVDGVGKSTQIGLLTKLLSEQNGEVVTCRDPGTTPLGEKLRGLLLDRHGMSIHRRSEMLMYMAARAQMVEEVIRPALESGKHVISDRFLLANVVYQGWAGGLSREEILAVGEVTVAGIKPDLNIILDMPADAAGKRIQREPDRMEAQGLAYMERVREGFLQEAKIDPQHVIVVNAARSIEEVHADVRRAALRVLQGLSPQEN
ncbi:MAG: dTMP kinase [Planctomycetaceae bacterium]